jgi:energy-converting hydrogenase Eha subunit A
MEEYREKLEKMYQKLNEEEDPVLKKWYQSLIPKAILLFPVVAFGLTFLKVNTINQYWIYSLLLQLVVY